MTASTKPLTPFEMGVRDASAAIARGEIPCGQALARAAAILANSAAFRQWSSRGQEPEPGAAA